MLVHHPKPPTLLVLEGAMRKLPHDYLVQYFPTGSLASEQQLF